MFFNKTKSILDRIIGFSMDEDVTVIEKYCSKPILPISVGVLVFYRN